MKLRVLIFGDVVGKIGRQALSVALSKLKVKHKPDLIIANAENLAHGRGITGKTVDELLRAGVDVFTSGHHVWENPTGLSLLNDPDCKIIRPYNAAPDLAGKGYLELNLKSHRVIILNLQGQLFMSQEVSSPFLAFDGFWNRIATKESPKPIVILDMHAEATSEKEALGHYVDGRATLLFGSHTHVPTADEKILPGGTGYITDVGMSGALDSVIGFEKNSSIKRFLNTSEAPYLLDEKGKAEVNGLLAIIDLDSSRVVKLDRIREIVDI